MDRNALMDLLGYGRDFAQGASNAVASNVSGPVDALSWLLRKAGAGRVIGDAPVGGSEWMARQGLTAQPKNALAGILGESAGLSGPMVLAAKAPQVANALNRVVENAAVPSALNPELGAIVYHGSPHKFDAFDASKIGTGEGAQAYGHGLYLAETPEVARSYRSAGADPSTFVPVRNIRDPAQMAATALERASGDMRHAQAVLAQNVQSGDMTAGAALQLLKQGAALPESKYAGKMYKVDLPDPAIAKMLDWDLPLGQQAPEVQAGVRKAIQSGAIKPEELSWIENMLGDVNGARIYGAMKAQGQPAASEALRQAGIPGIRYLDAGSRGAGTGTRNYVVFPKEESALTILERNGQPVNALQNVVREPPSAYGSSMGGNVPSAAAAGQPTWAGFSTPEEYAAALARDAEHSARMQAAWRKSGLWERPAGYVPEKIGGEPKPWLYKRGPYGGFDTPEEFAAARLRQNGGQPGL